MTKKITLTTFKSFLKKNQDGLLVSVKSSFSGMSDMVERCDDNGFSPAQEAHHPCTNNFGIQGIWCVFGSRDSFRHYEDDQVVGIETYNCCGSFIVAVAK